MGHMTITRVMWTAAVVWAAVGCLAGIGLAQQAKSPDSAKAKATPAVLLEKGIYTEETVGDLDAAIKVYQQIVDDAKANRKYAARAQYRLGMCHLKKGNKAKARQAFRELLATYPQEKLIAAKARGQLAKLTPGGGAAPCLVRTTPAAMANDVNPSLDKITVTFDRPMTDKSWSWTGGGETFPKIQTPSYDKTKTTCTLPVKLQPGKVYWVGINSPSHRNFKSADGTPAPWHVILFATKSADGKPTPLPDDLARRAAAINEASRRAAISETPAQAGVPRLPEEVMGYIISKHYEALRTAQEKQLRVNTHIYGVDERFALYSGGLLGYVNSSDKPQAGPIRLGNFGDKKPNYMLMDEAGRPQQFELRHRPSAKMGKYSLWWKPDSPVQPGANRLLGYISKDVRMLPMAARPDHADHAEYLRLARTGELLPGRAPRHDNRPAVQTADVKGYRGTIRYLPVAEAGPPQYEALCYDGVEDARCPLRCHVRQPECDTYSTTA